MRSLVVWIGFLMFTSVANAGPVPLVCRGDITIFGQGKVKIDETGSVLDFEKGIFTAPVYGTFPITRADDTTIVFGSETPTNSTLGNLALQLPFVDFSESMGNHDSKIVDAASVD